ncbi:MAG: aldehyde dehydrogenase [Bacteriovoracaceae bacterium]|nr:aldehyde dehydrogenase [Bacteriovoracaceae bacterium]
MTDKTIKFEKRSASDESKAIEGVEQAKSSRLNVLKTYKIYIDGKFPRSESGRYYTLESAKGKAIANVSLCSRKDFRDAVTAARAAQLKWASATAYNRGQILYRIAEMLEARRTQFIEELVLQGSTSEAAQAEVETSIDRLVYFAGWSDKYQQIFSSVNPVASSHFNFSILEPTGVVGLLAPEENSLLGLISALAPIIVGGNSCVLLASGSKPLCSVSFAEVLNSSDVPAGVVNILTGYRKELLSHFSSHMDVNAVVYAGDSDDEFKTIQQNAVSNLKRIIRFSPKNWYSPECESPYRILDCQETKTTWHPIGN